VNPRRAGGDDGERLKDVGPSFSSTAGLGGKFSNVVFHGARCPQFHISCPFSSSTSYPK